LGLASQYSEVFLLSEYDDLDIHVVKAGNQNLEADPRLAMLKNGKVVLVHAIKVYREIRGMSLLIVNLGTR
jgi:hypothetical protein